MQSAERRAKVFSAMERVDREREEMPQGLEHEHSVWLTARVRPGERCVVHRRSKTDVGTRGSYEKVVVSWPRTDPLRLTFLSH